MLELSALELLPADSGNIYSLVAPNRVHLKSETSLRSQWQHELDVVAQARIVNELGCDLVRSRLSWRGHPYQRQEVPLL